MSGLFDQESLWYLSRGAGTVLLVTSSAVMVLGILTRGGRTLPGLPKFAVAGLHRNLALLTLVLLGTHVIPAILDPYVTLRWADAILPFTSSYHPWTVGLGALALDLMLAVVVTALAREWLGQKVFRVVHWAAYLIWPVAVLHGFLMGPDITSGPLLIVAILSVGAVVAAVGLRTTISLRTTPQLATTQAQKVRPA